MDLHLILLAAGFGTRMKSSRSKVLHEIGNLPIIAHALTSGSALRPKKRVVITGHDADRVEAVTRERFSGLVFARQDEQLGTAHAVAQAAPHLSDAIGDVLVLYGDTPFIPASVLDKMVAARRNGFDVVVLGFKAADPGRYGRLVMTGDSLERIVEFKDASAAEQAIDFCNSGVVMCDVQRLFALIGSVGNDNAAGEYYLTDIVAAARGKGLTTTAVICDEADTLGVNSRADLARAEGRFQSRARQDALDAGVTLLDPESVYFSHDTYLAADVTVEQHVVFGPGVTADSGARIRAHSHLEGCHVSSDAVIGPFARLRPGALVGERAKVGNFVEIKNSALGAGAKVKHLSYVGDATVGARANIGAGVVTCNYDGVKKYRTQICRDAFIGSDTMLVAPVRVGVGAMTASGSVITADVPDYALALGRARQITKPGFVPRFLDNLKTITKVPCRTMQPEY